jgi:hypothetical protein
MRGFLVVAVLISTGLGVALVGPACGGSSDDAVATREPGLALVSIGALQVQAEVPGGDEFYGGLGGRGSLADDRAMLFVFLVPGQHAIWMRDMLIAIDIIWISADGRVVDIRTARPEPGVADAELRRYYPRDPASYVLEVRAGLAAEKGVQVGDEAEIELP